MRGLVKVLALPLPRATPFTHQFPPNIFNVVPLHGSAQTLIKPIAIAMTTHIHTGWGVDEALMGEEERLIVIRFGRDK